MLYWVPPPMYIKNNCVCRRNQVRSCQVKSQQVRHRSWSRSRLRSKSGQVRPGEVRSKQWSSQVWSGQVKPILVKSGQVNTSVQDRLGELLIQFCTISGGDVLLNDNVPPRHLKKVNTRLKTQRWGKLLKNEQIDEIVGGGHWVKKGLGGGTGQ